MKKGIIIGCIILALAALAWFGGRKLFGAKEGDTETAEAEVSADVSGSDVSGSDVSGSDVEVKEAESSENEEDTAESEDQNTVEEGAVFSDENTLYTIKTSDGNNLGMVPIVNGNAVVLMDGGRSTTYEGEYVPEEQSAYRMKLEEQTSLAASEGKIGAWAFYRESAMRNFDFPEGVNAIEKFAFARSGLTGIVIPEGVTSIGSGAFYHCDSLTSVVIPDSVTVIEENAFSHTPWLENWMADGGNVEDVDTSSEDEETIEVSDSSNVDDFLIVGDGILLAYRGAEENPELPPGVKSIAPGVFENIQ